MSTALDAFYAGRVMEGGRAVRSTTLRHTHLTAEPLGIAMWRLGGERFRAAAIAWGPIGGPFELAVAGEPRNRDLYFDALIPFAQDLCARVASVADARVQRTRGRRTDLVPADALQIVVPNRATVGALRLLGRYLAYLSDRSGTAPDPALVEAGRHLGFYAKHSRTAGQALLVPLDRLLAEHWATLLSPLEASNLAALDAQIDPPANLHAFEASAAAERLISVGPEPTEEIDRAAADLLDAFNEARAGSTDPAVVRPLIAPIRDHYRSLVEPVWDLMARSYARERSVPEAPSASRRFAEDREAFGRHADWVLPGRWYRTRDTARQAAMTLKRLEDAQRRYEAERAVDDPACMIEHLLEGDAFRGKVVSAKTEDVVVNIQPVPRAIVTIDSEDPVVFPEGKQLWWTATASEPGWTVEQVAPHGGGSRIVLMSITRPTLDNVPAVGDVVTYSTLHAGDGFFAQPLPKDAPWTHTAAVAAAVPEPIDAGDAESETPPVDATQVEDPQVYA